MAIDTIKSTAVLDGSIATADIADDAVTADKLATQTGNVDFADNAKVRLGTGNDLEIYHSGSHSFITDNGDGDLYIRGSDNIRLQVRNSGDTAWTNAIKVDDGAAASLMFDGDTKFATTSTGIDVTGDLTIAGSGTGVYLGGTGSANKLDDYEEGRFDILIADDNSGSETLSMRYTKVGQVVHVEGPNRGAAGSSNGQYAVLSNTGNSNINITSSLPFVPLESGSVISPIHRNLELRSDGTTPISGYWRPMLAWQASSATLYLADTRGSSAGEHGYWGGANGQTLRKEDSRTNIVLGFNFSYRTAS